MLETFPQEQKTDLTQCGCSRGRDTTLPPNLLASGGKSKRFRTQEWLGE
jgi:hypothetical protein